MAAAGAARVVAPDEVGAAAVRDAVRAVLADPAIRSGAERIAGEIAGLPGPHDVVPRLLSTLLVRKAVP
jgi:UDP:flavonoid glycosyltransferase YjiC (YdhE family)